MGDEEFGIKGGAESMFPSGDQDYASAIGWDGGSGTSSGAKAGSPTPISDRLIAEDRKRNPRAYAKRPTMLYSRAMDEWIGGVDQRPPVDGLFGPFWQRDELSILFAGTGVGKSALAVQIAEALARGAAFPPFSAAAPDELERERVLYIDFELGPSQLIARYARMSNDGTAFRDKYRFSSNLIRSELDWNGGITEGYNGFSDMFFTSLRDEVEGHEARAVIIDNITFLDLSSTSNANIALSIMRDLAELKNAANISILVLAHTPKRRPWDPLTGMDLQGSINLGNFADSIFAMGSSRLGADLRYVKQVKVRTGTAEFGAGHVPIFRLGKFDYRNQLENGENPGPANFLGYRFVEFGTEAEHLTLTRKAALRERKGRVSNKLLLVERAKCLAAEGKSSEQIGAELGISKTTAFRYARRT
ncbi:hypothetical protein BH10ACI2_BH10ACI2_03620 [soil metagenome]